MKIFLLIFGVILMNFSTDTFGQQQLVERSVVKGLTIEDVKFDYDNKLFSDVKSSVVPPSPLENKSDKPDYVQSRNIRFQLNYAKIKKPSAEISVYEINEYKDAFTVNPSYVHKLEKSFATLQDFINYPNKIKSFGLEQMPYVPFIDAHQEFYSKARILEFQNGKGLLFLTQINQDVLIINNERLKYIFQGLTNDKRYFIYAEFPVSAKGLPESDTNSFEGYTIPEYFYGDNLEENQKANKAYRKRIALKLEDLKEEEFSPKLSKVENLLFSLKIK